MIHYGNINSNIKCDQLNWRKHWKVIPKIIMMKENTVTPHFKVGGGGGGLHNKYKAHKN
jgi:hypothetical protein